MSGADFLDTNLFVYVVDDGSPGKQAIARRVLTDAHNRQSGVISFQVVQETLQVSTRNFRVIARPVDAQDLLRDMLLPLWRVMPSAPLYSRALTLQARLRFSFYDSLIVAAALEGGCKRLLTEDLQHGQRIDTLSIENPFLAA